MKSALLLFALAAPAAAFDPITEEDELPSPAATFKPSSSDETYVDIVDGYASGSSYSPIRAAVYWCVLESPVGNCIQLANTNVQTGGTITDADGNDITVVGMSEHDDTTYGAIGTWDTSNVQDMRELFYDEHLSKFALFNQDIGSWVVSSVTDMTRMFKGAEAFNQDISSWDVLNVWSFEFMFQDAIAFDQDISSWRVCGNPDCWANTFTGMFDRASAFSHMLCGGEWVYNYAAYGGTSHSGSGGGSSSNSAPVSVNPSNPDEAAAGPIGRRLSAITFGNGGGIAETECYNLCPAGKWSHLPRTHCHNNDLCRGDQCELCPAGTYSEDMHLTKSDDCTHCLDNQESSADRTACTSCPSGYVQQNGECTTCEAGKYVKGDGTQCEDCPAGTYSISGEGQTSSDVCLPCAVGTINTVPGRTTECENCPTDTWTVRSGRTLCVSVEDMLTAGGFESLDDSLSAVPPSALAAAVKADPIAYQMAGLCP